MELMPPSELACVIAYPVDCGRLGRDEGGLQCRGQHVSEGGLGGTYILIQIYMNKCFPRNTRDEGGLHRRGKSIAEVERGGITYMPF